MMFWKKYIGAFVVLSFLMAGIPGMSYASIICKHGESMTESATQQDDCHGTEKKADKTKSCCGILCDGMSCGKMPVVAPVETVDFKTPPLSGYEVFDLTSGGERLEKLMRPPILR